jgi:hypothetical protein
MISRGVDFNLLGSPPRNGSLTQQDRKGIDLIYTFIAMVVVQLIHGKKPFVAKRRFPKIL